MMFTCGLALLCGNAAVMPRRMERWPRRVAQKHAKQGKAMRAGASLRDPLQLHQAVCADKGGGVHIGCRQNVTIIASFVALHLSITAHLKLYLHVHIATLELIVILLHMVLH